MNDDTWRNDVTMLDTDFELAPLTRNYTRSNTSGIGSRGAVGTRC